MLGGGKRLRTQALDVAGFCTPVVTVEVTDQVESM